MLCDPGRLRDELEELVFLHDGSERVGGGIMCYNFAVKITHYHQLLSFA